MKPATVLATVNAPYREKLTTQALVDCLLHPGMAKAKPGHVSSFLVTLSRRSRRLLPTNSVYPRRSFRLPQKLLNCTRDIRPRPIYLRREHPIEA